jgi:protease IV
MSQQTSIQRLSARIGRGLDLTRRVILNIVFFGLLAFVLIAVTASDRPEVPGQAALVVNPKGMLVDQLTGTVLDRAINRMMGQDRPETLVRDVVRSIELAKDDRRITALVLDLDNLWGGGLTKLQDIARAVENFRESGKPVYAVGDSFGQPHYFLAAHADHVWMHPSGMVLLTGFERYRNYYREAIDMLDVEWNVFRVGEYKSFVEPYTRSDMSPEDREAALAYLTDMWEAWIEDVAPRRGLGGDEIRAYVNELPDRLDLVDGDLAAMAQQAGLVDELLHRDQMAERIREVAGEGKGASAYSGIGIDSYLEARKGTERSGRRDGTVAVIMAVGTILDGTQPPGTIGGDSTARLIRDARLDDSVKAVVLRVDSPGGSAFASDVILREVELTQQAGKPVVVSMGSVAASGGYWISMSADEIWAHPATVTGSIGILAMFPTFEETLKKIGITTDGVGTTEMSGVLRADRALGEPARRAFQSMIDHGYREFITKVAEHRDMSVEEVDAVARGRVWSGVDAQRAGLVDRLGDVQDAIASAAAMAELETWRVRHFERQPSLREQFFADMLGGAAAYLGPGLAERRLYNAPHRQILETLRRDLEQLDRFNDPRNLYYYCAVCVTE